MPSTFNKKLMFEKKCRSNIQNYKILQVFMAIPCTNLTKNKKDMIIKPIRQVETLYHYSKLFYFTCKTTRNHQQRAAKTATFQSIQLSVSLDFVFNLRFSLQKVKRIHISTKNLHFVLLLFEKFTWHHSKYKTWMKK